MLQSLGRPEMCMALDVTIVSGSGQEHEGCLLLTSEVLFVVSLSEDTQQQAFPVTEIECSQDTAQDNLLKVILKQQRVPCELEVMISVVLQVCTRCSEQGKGYPSFEM
ncbi:VP13B protein, partial [Polyodon spathula]|nr:VP13B protein [Polyodon spathula]